MVQRLAGWDRRLDVRRLEDALDATIGAEDGIVGWGAELTWRQVVGGHPCASSRRRAPRWLLRPRPSPSLRASGLFDVSSVSGCASLIPRSHLPCFPGGAPIARHPKVSVDDRVSPPFPKHTAEVALHHPGNDRTANLDAHVPAASTPTIADLPATVL